MTAIYGAFANGSFYLDFQFTTKDVKTRRYRPIPSLRLDFGGPIPGVSLVFSRKKCKVDYFTLAGRFLARGDGFSARFTLRETLPPPCGSGGRRAGWRVGGLAGGLVGWLAVGWLVNGWLAGGVKVVGFDLAYTQV